MRRRLVPIQFSNVPAVDPATALLAKFEGAGDDAGLSCFVAAGETTYRLYQHLGSRRYWEIEIGPEALGVGQETLRVENAYIRKLYRYLNQSTTPAMTFTGSGWLQANNSAYIGGIARYNGNVGTYAEVTTPAGVTSLGMQGTSGTNCGLALVTIDGSKTLADLLPTAQSLVDAGTFPNTILVANGGTLNPTDRVWDHYQSPPTLEVRWFSHSLTAGAHTIRVTNTGYKRAAASDYNVLITVALCYGATVGSLADPYYMVLEQGTCSVVQPPVWEISWNTKPTGATQTEWMGHVGSQKVRAAMTITADGEAITPTDGNTYRGNITITIPQSLRHSEIDGGATEIGTCDMVYSLDKTTGLTISYTLTWTTNGTTYGYPAMYTIDKTFDRCRATDTAVAPLDNSDESVQANTATGLIWAWDLDGYQGVCQNLTLSSVNNWLDNPTGTPNFMGWRDMNNWSKSYAWRYPDTVNYTIGQQLISECNYRAQWFPGGANAALA